MYGLMTLNIIIVAFEHIVADKPYGLVMVAYWLFSDSAPTAAQRAGGRDRGRGGILTGGTDVTAHTNMAERRMRGRNGGRGESDRG